MLILKHVRTASTWWLDGFGRGAGCIPADVTAAAWRLLCSCMPRSLHTTALLIDVSTRPRLSLQASRCPPSPPALAILPSCPLVPWLTLAQRAA